MATLADLESMVIKRREEERREAERLKSKFDGCEFESRDSFTKEDSVLNKGNFTLPGQGISPDYCHTPFIGHIHESGNSAVEMVVTCKLSRCPSCYKIWVDQQVFRYTLLLELYSRFIGSRPSRAISSVNTNRLFTLDSLRKFRRTAKNRIRKQGVTAGFSLDHPFRIKSDVKTAIRALRVGVGSGGMWDFLLEPGSIPEINEYIGHNKYCTWRDCVELSPHTHYLLFPGNQKITGNEEIFIKKLITKHEDGSKTITLDTTEDIIYHIRYLISHCEILINAGKFRSEPASIFGDLWRWDYTEHFDTDEIMSVQAEILEIFNRGRSKKYILDSEGSLIFSNEDENNLSLRERGFLPIHELVPRCLISHEAHEAWLASIENYDNREYCEYLIDKYKQLKDAEIPGQMKRLFTSRSLDPKTESDFLRSPPDTFEIVTFDV